MPGYGSWTIPDSPQTNPVTLSGDVGGGNTFSSLGCTNTSTWKLRLYDYGSNNYDIYAENIGPLDQQTIQFDVTVPLGSYNNTFTWGIDADTCGQTDTALPQNPWIVYAASNPSLFDSVSASTTAGIRASGEKVMGGFYNATASYAWIVASILVVLMAVAWIYAKLKE